MIRSRFVCITDSKFAPVSNGHKIWTTLEGENPGGSIKDHMVSGELQSRLADGSLKKGDTISEISAGSTARSLAYYAQAYGLRCVLFVPYNLPEASQALLRELGAELRLADPKTAYAEYDQFTAETQIARLDQFGKRALRFHYNGLAEKILTEIGSPIDFICGGVGTGHSLAGVSEVLRSTYSSCAAVTAEPTRAGAVSGIRNLVLESYAEKDPCDVRPLLRTEVSDDDFFSNETIETNLGAMEIAPSFRVVLGAIRQRLANVASDGTLQCVFALGASNRLGQAASSR